MRRVPTIIQAMTDEKFLGRLHDFSAPTWAAWRSFLKALFGLPMTSADLDIWRECTGRDGAPTTAAREAWLICGRRSGKSYVLALIAVYLACVVDYARYLSAGERATVMILAADRKQARVIFRFVRGMLYAVPALKRLIERETAEGIDLSNSITIEIQTAATASVRGYTLAAVLADEAAFWRAEDSTDPDVEVLRSVRPGMATIPSSMMLVASSPYARRGALWAAWRKHYGKDGPVIVFQAATRRMNPSIPEAEIAKAFEDDPVAASAEYGAAFRADIAAFVQREAVEACVSEGVRERPRQPFVSYHAFVDPSGGSADGFTLGIAHRDKDGTAVLDLIRERRPPFSPERVVEEFCADLKRYGVMKVTGDRYAGEWPREQFRKRGITYEPSERTKSEIYVAMLAAINSAKCDLLDEPKLIAQICGLERRTARGGKDSIDHAPGAHDDVCNAALGALLMCERKFSGYTAGLMADPSLAPGYRGTPLRINPGANAAEYIRHHMRINGG